MYGKQFGELELYDLSRNSRTEPPRRSQNCEISAAMSHINMRQGSKSNFCESPPVRYALPLFLLGRTAPDCILGQALYLCNVPMTFKSQKDIIALLIPALHHPFHPGYWLIFISITTYFNITHIEKFPRQNILSLWASISTAVFFCPVSRKDIHHYTPRIYLFFIFRFDLFL